MNRSPRHPVGRSPERDSLKDELYVKLAGLEEPQLALLLEFLDQIVACHDPEVVGSFLKWRDDPTIGSILQIAAAISGDLREQLLFSAEVLYSTEIRRH